jgi:multidrug resistance efflux pump
VIRSPVNGYVTNLLAQLGDYAAVGQKLIALVDTEFFLDRRLLRASVNPIFTWARLVQRVPVRIHIDQVPDAVRLVAGMTATVQIDPRPDLPSIEVGIAMLCGAASAPV